MRRKAEKTENQGLFAVLKSHLIFQRQSESNHIRAFLGAMWRGFVAGPGNRGNAEKGAFRGNSGIIRPLQGMVE